MLDFGVAKVKETVDGATKTGAVLGTPYYMSPEQARGSREIDHRSDLWALAVVTYQCITGQLPFMGEALGDLFVKIIVEPLPVPSRVAQVPPGFDGWWMRAAARDPGQRFQNAKELTDNLALALGVTAVAGVEVGSPMMPSEAGAPWPWRRRPSRPPGPAAGPTRAARNRPSSERPAAGLPQSGPQRGLSEAGPQQALYQSGPQPAYQSGQSLRLQRKRSSRPPTQERASVAAYQSGQAAAYQSGQAAAYQSGQSPAFQHQSTGGVLGSAPLQGTGTAAVPAPARSGRGGLVVGILGVVALVGGGGAFFASRSHADTKPAPTAAATAAPSAPATATPSAARHHRRRPRRRGRGRPPRRATRRARPRSPSTRPRRRPAPGTPQVPGPALPPPPKPTAVPGGGRAKTDFGF